MQGLRALFSAARQPFRSGGGSGQAPAATTASPAYELREENLGRLHRAAAQGDLAWLRRWRWWLKRAGMDRRDEQQWTPLHLACANGHEDVVRYLLRKNCQLNAVDSFKKSPLMKAVECEQESCVAILLAYGADPNLADADGNTALHLAVLTSNVTLVVLLLEHNAKMDVQNQDGFTPLGLAASIVQEQRVELLQKEAAERHAPEEQASGDLTDSPLREGEAAASCQEPQDLLLASSGSDATVKGVEDSVQRLESEDARLEGTVAHQSSWSEALQRDVQGSASVAEPYRKLANECWNCMQLKAANRCLQEELSAMCETCEELLKRQWQLEEEVAELKRHMETNMVSRRQAERYKRKAADLYRKLQDESEKCMQQKVENFCLQEELRIRREKCEELQEREWQLEEEVAELRRQMETNRVDGHRAKQSGKERAEELIRVLGDIEEEAMLMLQAAERSWKLENEPENCMQQEVENCCLQGELSTVSEKCEELEESERQLEEEVAELQHRVETNRVDGHRAEQPGKERAEELIRVLGDIEEEAMLMLQAAERSRKLENEPENCMQQEVENCCLQGELSTVSEKCEELEESERQLEEEVAELQHRMETNRVDGHRAEQPGKERAEELIRVLGDIEEEAMLMLQAAEHSRKLENEPENCMQQEVENCCLQGELSTVSEKCEELEESERQLEEEVAELQHRMETNRVDGHRAEQSGKERAEELIRVLGDIEKEAMLMLQNLCQDRRLQEGCLQAEQETDKKPNLDVDGDRPKSR